MTDDHAALHNALSARDPRFDGVFYVGVTSTGIYCRPICPARTPKAANCRFFPSAEAAEKDGFRPCLRCRPELAPGNAPVDDAQRVASLIVQRIDEGMLDDAGEHNDEGQTQSGLEGVAERFGWSSRQIRRIVNRELGVSPMELVLTRRLLLAKQLLTDTKLPITQVASASGFASLRRFNDAFRTRYGMPPSRFRKAADGNSEAVGDNGSFTLQLSYRPPFDWQRMVNFLGARAMKGVESVTGDSYARTVRMAGHRGWVVVRHRPERRTLLVEMPHTLTPALPAVLGRLRNMFDLSARPDVIASHLSTDPLLTSTVAAHPGLRVPGAFDGFELAVRAVLGQQISVKGATTLAGRFSAVFGEPITTPHEGLISLSPTAERVSAAAEGEITSLGIVGIRARCIIALATEVAAGRLVLEAGADPERTMEQLIQLPGIGPWTAHYICMRALRWPDAFPKEDMVLRKVLGGVTAARAEALSQAWRPWRSYATLQLWASTERSGGSV